MKTNKLISIAIGILIFGSIMSSMVFAQDNVPTTDPTPPDALENSLEKNAQILKDKIATKVAELSKQADMVVTGIIKSIDDNNIVIVDDSKHETTITTDEVLTTYKETSIGSADELERDSLEKNDYIVVSGKKIDNDLASSKVYLQKQYIVATGQITEVDEANFTVSVVTVEKDAYVLDVEKSTVTQIMDTDTLELVKAGFSKLKIGDNVHFVIQKPTAKKTKTVSAIRLLVIPQEYFTK